MRWMPDGRLRAAAASFAGDAWTSFRRNGLMTAAAVTTITVALLVVGAAVLLGLNLGRVASMVEEHVQVVAFLQDGLSPAGAENVRTAAAALPGVQAVRFVGREEALSRLQAHLGEGASFADLVGTNPLPDSLELVLTDPSRAAEVAEAVARQPGVTDVGYGGQVVDRLLALTRGIRLLAGMLTLFLAGIALVVVVNTIRLTVIARRQEIEIMALVGATRWFIRWPFVLEGLFEGVAAGALAVLVLGALYVGGVLRLAATMPFLPLVAPAEAALSLLGWVLTAGAGVGTVGSLVAIRRFLVT
jgi:cell division transport system permease protein